MCNVHVCCSSGWWTQRSDQLRATETHCLQIYNYITKGVKFETHAVSHESNDAMCVSGMCFFIFVVVDVCINYTKCIQQAAAEKEKKQQTQNWTDGFTNSITRPLIQSPKKGKMQIWLNECIVHGVRRINAKRLILLHHTHFIGLIQITCYHFIIGITGFKINDAMHLWMELQSIGRFASITMYWVLCGTWVHFGIITDGNRRRVMLILWIPFN